MSEQPPQQTTLDKPPLDASSPEYIAPDQLLFEGLFLDKEERERLIRAIGGAYYPNVDADHITTLYHGNNPTPPAPESLTVGEVYTVKVIGIVIDTARQVQTVLVDLFIEGKPYPHITISTGNDANGERIPPVVSNEAIAEAIRNNTVLPAPENLTVQMKSGYCLGDYDNGQGTIVTSSNEQ